MSCQGFYLVLAYIGSAFIVVVVTAAVIALIHWALR
jgi:hypothetical protein